MPARDRASERLTDAEKDRIAAEYYRLPRDRAGRVKPDELAEFCRRWRIRESYVWYLLRKRRAAGKGPPRLGPPEGTDKGSA